MGRQTICEARKELESLDPNRLLLGQGSRSGIQPRVFAICLRRRSTRSQDFNYWLNCTIPNPHLLLLDMAHHLILQCSKRNDLVCERPRISDAWKYRRAGQTLQTRHGCSSLGPLVGDGSKGVWQCRCHIREARSAQDVSEQGRTITPGGKPPSLCRRGQV
jgi:hypothetical protein